MTPRRRRPPAIVLFFVASCVRAPAGAPAPPSADGVWGGTRVFAPEGAPLVVDVRHAGGRWSVRAAGREAELVVVGERSGLKGLAFSPTRAARGRSLVAELPGAGAVRLRTVDPSAEVLAGHWIQPPHPNLSSPYATPLSLTRSTAGRWTARVTPPSGDVELYLRIRGRTAFIREPGTNFGRRVGAMAVDVVGSTLRFTPKRGRPFTGEWDRGRGTIALDLDAYGDPLILTRRGRDEAPGYYPRAASESAYRYTPPVPAGDGWPVASLSEVGLAEEPIARLVQSILDSEPAGWTSPYPHALLVARRGRLVLEEYFYGHHQGVLHDSRSAGKSWATTLVGIAVRKGVLKTADPVLDRPSDRRRAALRIEHLLTMTSGFDCDDNDDSTPGNEDVMQSQDDEPDWHRYLLKLDLVRDPGAAAVYCSAGINLLGAAIAAAADEWIPDFFAEELAGPLEIHRYHFNLMPTGEGYLGGGLRLTARDFAKLGQVFLSGGVWKGRRVVNEDWVDAATSAHAAIHSPGDYGYGWWRISYEHGGERIDAFYASGNGGQLIIAVPSFELLVAVNAGNYGNYGTWRRYRDEWVPEYILPAAAPPGGVD